MEERILVNIDEWLLRRGYCTPERNYMNPDGTATSRVFKLREKDYGELSVDVESKTTHEIAVSDTSKFMLFRLANRSIVEIGLQTYHAPETDGSNDAHAVIIGLNINDEIMPGLLAKASKRVYI